MLFKKRKYYHLSVEALEKNLRALGISEGDNIWVHSSATDLLCSSMEPPQKSYKSIVEYAYDIINMLIKLIGEKGSIFMPTDGIERNSRAQLIYGNPENYCFNYKRAVSTRGVITEVFRRRKDTIRSQFPIFNVTGWGKYAEQVLSENLKSGPYPMDEHSPWYKFTQMNGKVILMGKSPLDFNTMITLSCNIDRNMFKRPVFFDSLVMVPYIGNEGIKKEVLLKILYAPRKKSQLTNYSNYLNQEYSNIYNSIELENEVQIVSYESNKQYIAVRKALEKDVTFMDPRFWPNKPEETFQYKVLMYIKGKVDIALNRM